MENSKEQEILEVWDWETLSPTGKKVGRNTAHMQGIPHEGVHLWIASLYQGEPCLLLQKRASHKDSYPGFLDITVGGHVPFGLEGSKLAKEAWEEIGIIPDESALVDLGYCRYEAHEAGGRFHREIQHVYFLYDNRSLDSYTFNDGEVTGLYRVRVKDFKRLFYEEHEFDAEVFDGKRIFTERISKKDFHPLFFDDTMKNYMRVIFDSSLALLSGKRVNSFMPFKKN